MLNIDIEIDKINTMITIDILCKKKIEMRRPAAKKLTLEYVRTEKKIRVSQNTSVMIVPIYQGLILRRPDGGNIDTNVEPGERGSNYVDSAPFSAAPNKKERKKGERKKLKSIQRRCIGTPSCVRRPSRIHVSSSCVRTELSSRAEFLTTARILSLAGQLVAGISRERIDFSSLLRSFLPTRCVSIPSSPFSRLFSSPHFLLVFLYLLSLPCNGFHLTPCLPCERVRFDGRSFSPRRDATLRLALFSRRISLIFRLLFPVLRINDLGRAAPVS